MAQIRVLLSTYSERHLNLKETISPFGPFSYLLVYTKGNRKAMNRNWSNQKANPALKT